MRSGGVLFLLAALLQVSIVWLRAEDCNRNGIDDAAEIRSGFSPDCNANGVPDECDTSAAAKYDLAGAIKEGAASDLNGDGFLDLAFATRSPDGMEVLLNRGDGTFAAPDSIPIDQTPYNLAIGDLDGDGDADIAVGGEGPCPLIILFNQGDGKTFSAAGCAYGKRVLFTQKTAADLDRNGRMDLAALDSLRGTVSILLNLSGGTFYESQRIDIGTSSFLLVGDFNSDENPDLLTRSSVFLNDGNGTFWSPLRHEGHRFDWWKPAAAGDFDGSGYLDLVLVKEETVSVLFSDGSGSFPTEVKLDGELKPSHIVPGDFDGNGVQDIAIVDLKSSRTQVFISDGNGGFALAASLRAGCPLAADLDGDGDQDLAISRDLRSNIGGGPNELWVFLSKTEKLFDHSLDLGRNRNGIPDECECLLNDYDFATEDYFFTFSSDQGAAGDVVAVDISLTVEGFRGRMSSFVLVGSYDVESAELLEPVSYTESFDRLSWISNFFRLGTPPQPMAASGGLGFLLHGTVHDKVAKEMFSPGLPVHLATLYFRLKGNPGDFFPVKICDDEFRYQTMPDGNQGGCLRTWLAYLVDDQPEPRLATQHALSTRHLPGTVRIVPGAPTRPDLPDLPPDAKVYTEREVEEMARIRFELSGGFAQPGATGVPVEVHATSNLEFSGFQLEVMFPRRYLELARVEEHTRPGLVSIDNVSGRGAVMMMNSTRRVGAENERVHLATLIFDVRNEAGEVRAIPLEFGAFKNRLAIRTRESLVDMSQIPDISEVAPIAMVNAALQIGSGAGARLGDSNLDGSFDVTDPVNVLSHLFAGGAPPECFGAADFAADGELNVTDAIRMLSALFLGDPPRRDWENREVLCH